MNLTSGVRDLTITQEELKRILRYDARTGIFTWRVRRGGTARVGSVAGTRDTYGYVQITAYGILYLAHRLAWLYMTGEWPAFEIDHRDRMRHNNIWSNLRPADRAISGQNRGKASSKNTTGLLGVSHSHGRFCARISVGGRSRFLGDFDTPELAHAAYMAAKRELHAGFVA